MKIRDKRFQASLRPLRGFTSDGMSGADSQNMIAIIAFHRHPWKPRSRTDFDGYRLAEQLLQEGSTR